VNPKTEVTERTVQPLNRLNRRQVLAASLGSVVSVAFDRDAAGAQNDQDATPLLHAFPGPGWQAASHLTQISFRGGVPDSFGSIYANGPLSGEHSGTIKVHSDDNGFSWFPDFAFKPGEDVSVHTRLNVAGSEDGDFTFRCAIPTTKAGTAKGARNDDPKEEDIRRFRSRPGLLPPKLTAEKHGGAVAPGQLFLSVIQGKGQNGALIIDDTGEPVWYLPATPNGHEMFDLKVVEYQGEPVLAWWEGIRVLGQGSGHWVIADSSYETIATVAVGNGYPGGDMHDVLLTSNNSAIVAAYNTIAWDLSDLGGKEDGPLIDCVLQEIDIATGCVIFEWHNVDHVDLGESYREIDPKEPDAAHDYFHYNSVAEDEDRNLIISARNTWATYKLDRESGEILWRLGGKQSDFKLDEGAETAWQHDARPLGNGVLSIFDNAAAPKIRDKSRGLILNLDGDQMRAKVEREYVHPEGISAGSQGSMQVLPNGNVLIGWGSEPLLSEFAADGALILDIRFPAAKQSYRAKRFEWVGRPNDLPRLLVEPKGDGSVAVYASWNGATEIAEWRVLGGADEKDLSAIGKSSPRTGFETTITLTSDASYFAVEALDAQGASLGISKVVKPTEPSS
jgi:arylsulfotransferase ASST